MYPTSPTATPWSRRLPAARALLVSAVLVSLMLAGCSGAPQRDLRNEASDRLEYARDNNAYDPIGRLAGPQTIAPGAVVWYSAVGSHDPDFIGAKRERDEAQSEGGIHYQDDTSDIHFTWWVPYAEEESSLGTGIRTYLWQVDDGPVLESAELTERFATEDGPVRFPVGFAEPGMHTIRLIVVDWSGDRDGVTLSFEVAEGGAESAGDLTDWSATPEGLTYTRAVTTSSEADFGECPLGRDTYDATQDHASIPWDILYFSDAVKVNATWPKLQDPSGVIPADPFSANTNDIDLTLGHCAMGSTWFRTTSDARIDDDDPIEQGEVTALDFAQHAEKTGFPSEYRADFDHNVFHSEEGLFVGGSGTDVTLRFTFVPATSTGGGSL